MKKSSVTKSGYSLYSIVFLIWLGFFQTYCEGWVDLYLFNCSGDKVIIEFTLSEDFKRKMLLNNKLGPSDSIHTIPYEQRISYYQRWFNSENIHEKGNLLVLSLEPEEGLRIIHKEFLIVPSKIRDRDFLAGNVSIKAGSYVRTIKGGKEFIEHKFDKRCENGLSFKTKKYGRNGKVTREFISHRI